MLKTKQTKKYILIVRATKNNMKFFIYNFTENIPVYRLTTRNPNVKTKNKLSAICITSMCAELATFINHHPSIGLLLVNWKGLRRHRKLIFQLITRFLLHKCWILSIDDSTQAAHNGCRGVHLRRK